MLIFCSPLLNFIDLLSSPIKFSLKFSRLFSDCALNERDKCLLSFICSRSINDIFIYKDFPFMYSQQLILFKFIMPGILHILPFIRATFALFNSLQVTNIYFVSFVTDDGNKIPIDVNLCRGFYVFFLNIFNILPLFISISMGFNISCRSNFCWPLTISISIGSFIFFNFSYQFL